MRLLLVEDTCPLAQSGKQMQSLAVQVEDQESDCGSREMIDSALRPHKSL